MKCLKIDNNQGYFLCNVENHDYKEIDKITKEDLLYLLDLCTDNGFPFEMDELEEQKIQNQAHRIIYNHLYKKFSEILTQRDQFYDESIAMYKDAYEKYVTTTNPEETTN